MITIGVHILLVLTYRFIPVSNHDLVPTSATMAAYISLLVVVLVVVVVTTSMMVVVVATSMMVVVVVVVIVIIYAKTIVFIAN